VLWGRPQPRPRHLMFCWQVAGSPAPCLRRGNRGGSTEPRGPPLQFLQAHVRGLQLFPVHYFLIFTGG
jgi:hypothetical protein